jgi:glycerophosphoryl diester phosphodiesterase
MRRPLVIAHRGASDELPENTLAAFARAIELGADFVEFDVHPRGERELVVCHDPPPPAGPEPALGEVLELCRGRIGVMVELKSPHRYRRRHPVERVLELLDEEAVFVCFEAGAVARARQLRPGLRTVLNVGSAPVVAAATLGCWAVGLDQTRASAAAVRRAHLLGLAVAVYTVNDETAMLELASRGVEAIFTDRPRAALELLRPRSAT